MSDTCPPSGTQASPLGSSAQKMEYLKYKNAAFFHAARFVDPSQIYILSQDPDWEPSIMDSAREFKRVIDPGYGWEGYYDLVLIQFRDEEGYHRALFCPLPIVAYSRTRGAKRLREIIREGPTVLDIGEFHSPSRWVYVEGAP